MIKVPGRVWQLLDLWAHKLHNRHLLPRSVLDWACTRLDEYYMPRGGEETDDGA